MSKQQPDIDAELAAWLERQHVFFVATAPLSQDGHETVLNNKLEKICKDTADQVRKHLEKVKMSDLVGGRK